MSKIEYPSDTQINKVLSSYGIKWQSSDVRGLSFLGNGRAKESWGNYASDIPILWDRIGRVRKTKSGTEWLLTTRYLKLDECLAPAKALTFSKSREPGIIDSTDLHSRVSILEFLRSKIVCCRLLLVCSSKDNLPERVKSELAKIGAYQNSKIKDRIFLLEYGLK